MGPSKSFCVSNPRILDRPEIELLSMSWPPWSDNIGASKFGPVREKSDMFCQNMSGMFLFDKLQL